MDFEQRENAFRYITRKMRQIAWAASKLVRLREKYLSKDATAVCCTLKQSRYDILQPKKPSTN